jgi:glycosyltransferase involved in cell wall biosynthesis
LEITINLEIKIEPPNENKAPNQEKESSGIQFLRDQVTVVIPTLDEKEAIGLLIDEVRAQGYDKILVVDGYSKDNTAQVAAEHGAKVVGQHGKGKAGAVLVAREMVVTPYFLLMDGDYSYDPKDIDRFVLHTNGYDLIIGFRGRKCPNITRTHRLGNWILTKTFNLLMGGNVPDVACGMYLMKTQKIKEITLEIHDFAIDQEISAQMLIDGKVSYVPINYRARVGKAKATTWRQGFRALFTIIDLARQLNPILLFSFIAGLALIPATFLLGYASFLYLFSGEYRMGYFLGGMIFLVLGGQGVTVATVGSMLRRIERRVMNRI